MKLTKQVLEKQIKDNIYSRRWVFVGFIVAISAMALYKNLISGILGVILFQMIISLTNSIKQNLILIELTEE